VGRAGGSDYARRLLTGPTAAPARSVRSWRDPHCSSAATRLSRLHRISGGDTDGVNGRLAASVREAVTKQFAIIAIGVMFSGGAMVAPVLASTSDAMNLPDYTKHAADCLALLFTDPKAHAEQCGGPNFVVPDPPHGSTGYKNCHIAAIDAFGIEGVQYKLEASPGPTCCNISLAAPTSWEPLGDNSLVWEQPASTEMRVSVC